MIFMHNCKWKSTKSNK
ncbi:hypothetical protein J005_02525 [Cryptococcus neoformans]|nr:hypothetical protein C362_01003 [Cryptococcus neoformans var. grubii Bt1]OXH34485.1 hypothetical protein J005_02525 [Cryptococcus neoformans var. grubii]